MRDLVGVILSVGLPWVAGALCVRALWRADSGDRGLLCIGYGYLVGAFATTLLLRLVSVAGSPGLRPSSLVDWYDTPAGPA